MALATASAELRANPAATNETQSWIQGQVGCVGDLYPVAPKIVFHNEVKFVKGHCNWPKCNWRRPYRYLLSNVHFVSHKKPCVALVKMVLKGTQVVRPQHKFCKVPPCVSPPGQMCHPYPPQKWHSTESAPFPCDVPRHWCVTLCPQHGSKRPSFMDHGTIFGVNSFLLEIWARTNLVEPLPRSISGSVCGMKFYITFILAPDDDSRSFHSAQLNLTRAGHKINFPEWSHFLTLEHVKGETGRNWLLCSECFVVGLWLLFLQQGLRQPISVFSVLCGWQIEYSHGTSCFSCVSFVLSMEKWNRCAHSWWFGRCFSIHHWTQVGKHWRFYLLRLKSLMLELRLNFKLRKQNSWCNLSPSLHNLPLECHTAPISVHEADFK